MIDDVDAPSPFFCLGVARFLSSTAAVPLISRMPCEILGSDAQHSLEAHEVGPKPLLETSATRSSTSHGDTKCREPSTRRASRATDVERAREGGES